MKKICILLLFIGLFNFCYSQSMPKTYIESNSGKLSYGLFIPANYDSLEKYPLLMFLHGWGNNSPTYLDWYDESFQKNHPCFVYSPRTPTTWGDWSGWSNQVSAPMNAAIHVLDSIINVLSIDTNRLFIYGISMGGEGAFDLLHKYPNKFAAAMSVCGGGRDSWAEEIAKTPFWMFHGSADVTNPVALTKDVYKRLCEIGAKKMRFTEYPGYGHSIWEVVKQKPSWYDWMFYQSRDDTVCPIPTKPIIITLDTLTPEGIKLSWNDIRDITKKEDRIWYYNIYRNDTIIGSTEYNSTVYQIPTAGNSDIFSVSAVNYNFMESEKSNPVHITVNQKNNKKTSHFPSKLPRIFKKKSNLVIELQHSRSKSPVYKVEVFSLDGILLLRKDLYTCANSIYVDISQLNASVCTVRLYQYNNNIISSKVITISEM